MKIHVLYIYVHMCVCIYIYERDAIYILLDLYSNSQFNDILGVFGLSLFLLKLKTL